MVDRGRRIYFAEEESEFRERLREELNANATNLRMRRIASLLATDMSIAERMRELGFDGEAAEVFDLVPLVHVAWADGAIQTAERATIMEILDVRGIEPGSRAATVIASLLERRPSDAYLDESLALCRDMIGTREATAETVVELCIRVARAAGGFLGVGNKVSAEERQLLARIARQFGRRAEETFRRQFGAVD